LNSSTQCKYIYIKAKAASRLLIITMIFIMLVSTQSTIAQDNLTPTRTGDFDKGQCTWYVAEKRMDVFYWLPNSGADAWTWDMYARENGAQYGIEVKDMPEVGDIAVIQPGYANIPENGSGHVAYVESVSLDEGTFFVSEHNAKDNREYGEQTINIQDGITFIGMPTDPVLLAEIGLVPEQVTAYPYVVSRSFDIFNPIQNIAVASDVPFVLSINGKVVLEETSVSGYQVFRKKLLLNPSRTHTFRLEYAATVYERGAVFDHAGWPQPTVFGVKDEWFLTDLRREPPSINFGDLLESGSDTSDDIESDSLPDVAVGSIDETLSAEDFVPSIVDEAIEQLPTNINLLYTVTHPEKEYTNSTWIEAISFSGDGSVMATAARFNEVVLWDISTGGEITMLEGTGHNISGAVFNPSNSKELAIIQTGVGIWSLGDESQFTQLQPTYDFRSIDSSSNGRIVAGSADGRIIIWDAFDREQFVRFIIPDDLTQYPSDETYIRDIAMSHNGSLVATAIDDGSIIIWDSYSGQRLETVNVQDYSGSSELQLAPSISFSPDDQILAIGTFNSPTNVIILWDLGAESLLKTIDAFSSMGSLDFSPNGQFIATEGTINIQIYDVDSGELVESLDARQTASDASPTYTEVSFDPTGNFLAAGDTKGNIYVWQLPEEYHLQE